LNIGDIILKINGIDIASIDIFNITEMIAMQPLHSIVAYTSEAHRISIIQVTNLQLSSKITQNNTITTPNADFSVDNQTFNNDEPPLGRLRMNSPLKVIYVNNTKVQSKTGKDVKVGDIVTEINEINISTFQIFKEQSYYCPFNCTQ